MGLSDIWGDVSEAVEVSPGVPGQGLFSVPYSASSSLPPMPLIVNDSKIRTHQEDPTSASD